MTEIDQRSALMRLLRGAAVVAAGVAIMPGTSEAMQIASGGAAEVLKSRDLYERAQVVVVGPRPRRRRWVCWWHRGRRVCGWR